ncbi:MAG TPA: sulfur oxidation c-type cytochrome SoxA [Burkholderiales bacterium]|nr:sulfur oxidation c-type cytochrome SoxA [Burkholderiales bacterium]
MMALRSSAGRWGCRLALAAAAAATVLALARSATGQDSHALEQVQKYRQMLEEGNPAELSQARGEELWAMRRGPKHATLELCDLGLGPGRLEGAYAQLPRYFADTGRVQDVESRLVTCMTALQGLSYEQAIKDWYKPESELEALATYVSAKSKGVRIEVPAAQPAEAEMYAVGEALFFRRSGPLDFSCATCHSQTQRHVRLQRAPDFLNGADARDSMTRWPAYRASQGEVWTLERRLIDCIRQMRWPEPRYQSDALIALEVFLQKQANGGVMEAPSIKP